MALNVKAIKKQKEHNTNTVINQLHLNKTGGKIGEGSFAEKINVHPVGQW